MGNAQQQSADTNSFNVMQLAHASAAHSLPSWKCVWCNTKHQDYQTYKIMAQLNLESYS